MNTRLKQNLARVLIIMGTVGVASAIAIAADYEFAGTWKGSYTAPAPTPGAKPDAGTASAAGNAPAPAEAPSAGGGGAGGGGGRTKGGGGAPGGGGFGGAGGGFPSTGPQKITMRVKVNKEKDKASGNFTWGATTDDIHDGKIAGNKLTFKTGNPPATIYDYDAVLNGEELNVTRTPEGGRGRPQTATLKMSK